MELVFLLLLIPAFLAQESNINPTNGTNVTNTSSPSTPIRVSTPMKPTQIQQNLGTVRVQWEKEKPCHGSMVFSWNFTKKTVPLSFRIASTGKKLAGEMCEDRGCGSVLSFLPSRDEDCYIVEENLTVTPERCKPELIICKVKASKELVVYKSITGALLVLILAVILLRYARPAYEAFLKRFSKKHQNRWIGPTQSQSVSYHRGQQAGKPSDDTMKRQSFPGLERLTVNSSREPSSNRNSDYDSYGFN